MPRTSHVDLCVIGAGSAGLSVAAGAVQMGATVALIEKGRMGGECLNYGCVPSKSLIAAAHAARAIRTSGRFGVNGHDPEIDFPKVRDHLHGVIHAIAPHDSVERFERLGVDVVQASARFTGRHEIEAGDRLIRARRFVIAAGSSPIIPPISGLDDTPYLTNETIFDLDARPEHLIVVGGGPIGVELAQAYRRLGAAVTILERGRILPKDDPDAVMVIRQRLVQEGVVLHEGAKVEGAARRGNGIAVTIEKNGASEPLTGSHLLVAVGRRVNVDHLNLEAAGVAYGPAGIEVDRRLRTANRRIFAIGDAVDGYRFTHMAAYHAGIVIRNALFRLPARVATNAVPWVTYTDPELAHVGMTEAAAREAGERVRVVTADFASNDRAQTERETAGFAKIVVGARGRILGATIVGARAGELIQIWVLAITQGLKIGAMASYIAPYPTLGEISKRAAGNYYSPTLFGPRTRRLVRLLQKLG